MKKLEMAHDWFMKHANGNTNFIEIEVEKAWQYADAMQAEADKREDKSIPDVFKKDKDGNCLHTHTTFGGGECFDCGVNLEGEWQPDWSQAPDEYKWAGVTADYTGNITGTIFFISEPDVASKSVYSCYIGGDEAILNNSTFGYTGRWQDSLRKRPEIGFKRYYGDGLECAR